MKLSTLYTAVPEYIEFGWVTAPNASPQSISANTLTTLTLNTEVADTGNLVSAPSSNQVTIPAGTYYFKLFVPFYAADAYNSVATSRIISLFNVTANSYISRRDNAASFLNHITSFPPEFDGQFVLSSQSSLRAQILSGQPANIGNSSYMTGSGSTDAQRTTLQLWKLK